jgi:hypothetical protein
MGTLEPCHEEEAGAGRLATGVIRARHNPGQKGSNDGAQRYLRIVGIVRSSPLTTSYRAPAAVRTR